MKYVNALSTTGQFRIFGTLDDKEPGFGFMADEYVYEQVRMITTNFWDKPIRFEMGEHDAAISGPSCGLAFLMLVNSIQTDKQIPDEFVFSGELTSTAHIIFPGDFNLKVPYLTKGQILVTGDKTEMNCTFRKVAEIHVPPFDDHPPNVAEHYHGDMESILGYFRAL